MRLGVCYYLLGRYSAAIETLKAGDGGALAQFYLGKTYFARATTTRPSARYAAAAKAGYNGDDCVLGRAEAQRTGRRSPTPPWRRSMRCRGAVEQTAEYLYQRGATVAALGGNPHEVVALYERAVEADPNHAGALFGLAMENDRRGNDETALDLYERSAAQFPAHIGSLLNLGILYEDRQQYERAQQCYQRILDVYPESRPRPAVLQRRAGLGRHVLRRRRAAPPRPAEPGARRCRSPTSSCRSAAAIACKRWAS